MGLPQRLTFVTLGACSVARLRAFYGAWGWSEEEGGDTDYAAFVAGMAETSAAVAQVIQHPIGRDWGGYSGCVPDPEGHRWEPPWAPGITPD